MCVALFRNMSVCRMNIRKTKAIEKKDGCIIHIAIPFSRYLLSYFFTRPLIFRNSTQDVNEIEPMCFYTIMKTNTQIQKGEWQKDGKIGKLENPYFSYSPLNDRKESLGNLPLFTVDSSWLIYKQCNVLSLILYISGGT